MNWNLRRLSLTLALLSSPCIALAQSTPIAEQGAQTTVTLPELFQRIDQAEPVRRAGLKASLLRQTQQSVSMVVIVDDGPSYLQAISQWEGLIRFPILWDNGSVEARENIARFIRAYQPAKVYRLEDDGDRTLSNDRDERQEQIEDALSKAYSDQAADWRGALSAVHDQGLVSPGIVLTDAMDDAWPAAIALAAGRLQPLGFVINRSAVHKELEAAHADALERSAQHLAKDSGHSWEEIGDDIDVITLALNTGYKIKTGEANPDIIATTDRIGRKEHNGSGERWAWCGQIIGDEARSSYQAMCALFLQFDQAFIWDGYNSEQPWSTYDGTEAGEVLKAANLKIEVNDEPVNRIENWHRRMVNPVGRFESEPSSAVFMMMNSKGSARRFDLVGGISEEGRAGDVPTFNLPTALHIVHSFSLQQAHNPISVGGRLLERGVFAYAGSVDEPFLSGFVPTPLIARRMAGGLIFGAAVRYDPRPASAAEAQFDPSKVWKIAVLGDPMITFGQTGPRIEGDLNSPGLIDLAERVKSSAKDGNYTQAIEDLVMLGRDEDAARLAEALLKDQPEAFKPQAARTMMPVFQRTGNYNAMIDCFEYMGNEYQSERLMQDLLWLTAPYTLVRGQSDPAMLARVEALLRANLRSGQTIPDAERLAMHLRNRSMDSALGVLESLRPSLRESQIDQLDRAIARVKR